MMMDTNVGDGEEDGDDLCAVVGSGASEKAEEERVIALDVEGMMCQKNCGSTVRRAIEAVPGVSHAEVSFAARRAWAWLSPVDEPGAVASVARIVEGVEGVGFGAEASPNVELLVEGMMCQRNCGTTVKNALLASSPAVVKAEASFKEARARVWTRSRTAATAGASPVEHDLASAVRLMVDALEGVGFDASLAPTAVLEIDGMMCQKSCGTTVRGCLESIPGVERAEVSYAEGRLARVWARQGLWLAPSVLVGAVEDVGFGARVVGPGQQHKKESPSSAGASTATPTPTKEVWSSGGAGKVDAKTPKMLLGAGGASGDRGVEKEGGRGGGGSPVSIGVFSVSGMSCASCVGNVEKFVSALDGVDDVRVALLAEKAEIRHNPEVISSQSLADGITGLGYPTRHVSSTVVSGDGKGDEGGPAEVMDITLEVLGVAGPPCIAKIEAAVSDLPGIASCAVVWQQSSLAPTSGSAGDGMIGDDYHLNGGPVYLLTAVPAIGVPSPSSSSPIRRKPPGGGGGTADCAGGSEGGDAGGFFPESGSTAEAGGAGASNGGTKQSSGASGSVDGADDAVWEALCVAYDSRGRRRKAGVRDVADTVRGLGYGIKVVSGDEGTGGANAMESSQAAEAAEWRKLLLIAVGFTTPVMVLHLSDHLNGPDSLCGGEASYGTVLSWVLVTIVQFVVGKRFYRNAYKAAKHWSFGMDMLVVVGTSVSYLYSSLALLLACSLPGNQGQRPHLFLESSAMLLSFIALGKFLEVVAKKKTSQALVCLLSAQPHMALLVEPNNTARSADPEAHRQRAEGRVRGGGVAVADDGGGDGDDDDDDGTAEKEGQRWSSMRMRGWRERNIEASLVQPGDILRVLPGSQFPTDGTLLSGRTFVDESMITGESSPVAKAEGDPVCGGTANQHGSVLMCADRVGKETMLAQLCRLVEEAQMSKAPIQRHADRVAGVFVPAVISASLVTFLGWFIAGEAGLVPEDWLAEEDSDTFLFALLFGVSVVVVACPCALGLATPTAVMVGTGVGAGNGVLIKGGAALEAAHQVNAVIFDKTGTLTRGKPFLTDVVHIPSLALDRLMAASPAHSAGGVWPRPAPSEGTASHTAGASTEASAAAAAATVLALAAACEAYSEHPVARAIVDAAADAGTDTGIPSTAKAAYSESVAGKSKDDSCAKQQQQQQQQEQQSLPTLDETGITRSSPTATRTAGADGTTDFVSEPGCGVACQHPLGRVCVGTRGWGESNGGTKVKGKVVVVGEQPDSFEEADRIMKGLEEEGKTAVMVTVNGEAVGVVAVADADKEGSRRAVLALKRMGLDVWMVTGDNRRVAAALAVRLDIDPSRVMAEVLPAEKARKVQDLQLAGRRVAMVGDGVNDAPALATADVGIAVGAGTQVAMEAADVVLVRSNVCDVVSAIHLGRKVFGRIRLNFVFAMLYNLCGVPVAAGLLYPFLHVRLPPALAGLSMAMSSISVVLSSLALRFYRKPNIDDEGKLWEPSTTAAVLETISDGFDSVRRLPWLRWLLSRHDQGPPRFSVVSGGHAAEGDGIDEVERQPLGGRSNSPRSWSSSGSFQRRRLFATPHPKSDSSTGMPSISQAASLARKAGRQAARATAALGSARSYVPLGSESSRDESAESFAGDSVGAGEGNDVEMIGLV